MPLPERAAKRLIDVLSACQAIEIFVAGLSADDFAASELVRAAVERKFEIVGEALGQAAREMPDMVNSIPEIPRIVGLRNRLIHGYDSVDDQIIWDLVQNKLPMLAKDVSALLSR